MYCPVILLMKKNPANHLGCIRPCKKWGIWHIIWCRISEPSRLFKEKAFSPLKMGWVEADRFLLRAKVLGSILGCPAGT